MTTIKNKALPLLLLILISTLSFSCKKKKQDADSFTFAFLTDIHLQPEKNATEGFMKAIDTLNILKPDFVITGGDLIMDALAQKETRADSLYQLYKEVSGKLGMPVYNTMGNHEIFGIYEKSGIDPSHPLYGEKMFEARIGKRYYAFNHGGWRFYILDSIDEREDRQGYYGHIDSLQLEWIREDLKTVDKNTPLVISVHIPMISVQAQIDNGATAANGEGSVITNSKKVLDLFANHKLKLVLQGHLHYLEDIYASGTHFITGGAVSASWWNGPIGDLQEGFLLLKVKGDEFDWEYIDYGWEVKG
ncbi:MAG: metallophosphoesterase [Marinilabiliaceae bacterium]|jgi:3',5'-cyclic AMP phosphodiesterase CpdA|nr:metallophosphoesterase [Marinilabiliaceae bacterium]